MGVVAMMAVTMPVGVVSSAHCMQVFRAGKGILGLRVITVMARMPPFHNQKDQGQGDGAADDR